MSDSKPAGKPANRRKPAAKPPCSCNPNSVKLLTDALEQALLEIEALKARVTALEQPAKPRTGPSLQKTETYNGELAPEPPDNLKLATEDKLVSIRNAIAILPPNLVVDGRHTAENVGAICGFKVTEELLDLAYEGK